MRARFFHAFEALGRTDPTPFCFPSPAGRGRGEGERAARGTHGCRRGPNYAARHGGLVDAAHLGYRAPEGVQCPRPVEGSRQEGEVRLGEFLSPPEQAHGDKGSGEKRPPGFRDCGGIRQGGDGG
jgi:hypothetical protein